jgi:hypothetical protein
MAVSIEIGLLVILTLVSFLELLIIRFSPFHTIKLKFFSYTEPPGEIPLMYKNAVHTVGAAGRENNSYLYSNCI